VDDSQSVVLRCRARMAVTVLTLQQCWREKSHTSHRAIFVARFACRAVPFRAQDETLVQQPPSDLPEDESLGSGESRVGI